MKKKFIDKLMKKEDNSRRSIAITLSEQTILDIDEVIKKMNILSESDSIITRQSFLEESIKEAIEYTEDYLNEYIQEKNLNIQELLNESPKEEVYDTIVVPGQFEGFEEVFLKEKQWYYVKMDKKRVDKIKWIAIYVGKPVSAVTHYAKIKGEPIFDEKEGKYIIYIDGDPIKLENKIILGDINAMHVRSNKYITKQQLLEAKEYKDILEYNKLNK